MGTAFEKTNWQPGVTPYSTSQMNRIEDGIEGAAPVGTLTPFAGPDANVPTGWLVCDGTAVSRTTYDALWDAIGDTWGPGDGSTTFNLPDLAGLFPIGSEAGNVGTTGGSETHSHTNPSTSAAGGHSHTQPSTGSAGSHSHSNPTTGATGGHRHGVPESDSAGSHNHGSTGGPSNTTLVDTLGPDVGVGSATHTHSTSSGGGHTHEFSAITDDPGDHSHAQGNTGSGGSHSHSNPNTASVSNHQHTQGATNTSDHRPPWAAVTWLIRY